MDYLTESFALVRKSASVLAVSSDNERQDLLRKIAEKLNANCQFIFEENQKDMEIAREADITDAVLHRLLKIVNFFGFISNRPPKIWGYVFFMQCIVLHPLHNKIIFK